MSQNNDLSSTEKTYAFILRNRIVNSDDLERFAKEELKKDYNYLYRKFIFRLMKQGKVERIRNGIYSARNIYIDEGFVNDKFLIGSKIRSPYYLGYHTALELLGCAQSLNNDCHVAVDLKRRFRTFSHRGQTFIPSIVNDLGTEVIVRKTGNSEIRTSSPSRTFVECIQRPDLCMGFEEVYKSLESLAGVKIEGLFSVLGYYNTVSLFRYVGFFLEELKERSPYYTHIEEKDLNALRARIGKGRSHLIKGQECEYVASWHLYIPKGFRDLFLGVR